MIDGVLIEKCKVIENEKGNILHMLRNDASFFEEFGEVYFSFCEPKVVKGWKKHKKQTQHFAVPVGELKIVLYDDRTDSRTCKELQELQIGESQYRLVRIPPGVWYSFAAIGDGRALIANCTDIPHDPNESVSKELTDGSIPFSWGG